jgi:type I restriction enzyme S subunit
VNTIRFNSANFKRADLKLIRVLVPTNDEQTAIVRLLDHANRRIERTIWAKKKLIALLNEQKQAIIHRAVTRGLDPNVHLKPSGVPWLGDVPENWEVVRLKHLFREVDRRSESGREVLFSLRMYRGLVPHNEVSQIPIASSALVGFKQVKPGQLVMNRMRAAIGMFGVVSQPGLVSPDYAVFEARRPVEADYFMHLFKTRVVGTVFRLESKALGTGSSGFLRLYTDRFGAIKVPLPSHVEQRAIVIGIVEQTAEITRTAERVEREISLLREYRTRLTADVVTVKLDVREAAANLPEEPQPLEQTNELVEDEETAEGNLEAVLGEADA